MRQPGAESGVQATPPRHEPPLPAEPVAPPAQQAATPAPAPSSDSGLAIYEDFRTGLADPACGDAPPRWRKHFAHAPRRLGDAGTDTLPLFGYVVDSLRDAGLPTEFALIPFIESGYAPGVRSKAGPAGLWQFVAVTARGHGVHVEPGYDGRLSPAESTRAAVSYLKRLYDTFDGNWQLTVMAYNAGEYRVLQMLKRQGVNAGDANAASIKGLPPLTYAYVEKVHALACLLEEAGQQPQWRAGLDQPVSRLHAMPLEDARSLDAWAAKNGHDAATLRRLNPALAGRWPTRTAPWALVPASSAAPVAMQAPVAGASGADATIVETKTHTVHQGDSAWSIAKRYGVTTRRLLELNGLRVDSVLRPGMVLRLQ
ncbi:MAG: transglycosylase SLT domain-containing protein [Pseudoxanthomonas sp.]|nr:transglycosylase SLT domain-containing protein [Pseudoxanthomonas sp.]